MTGPPADLTSVITTAELIKLAGINSDHVERWIRYGYLEPVRGGSGSGRGFAAPRRWSRAEAEQARRMAVLTRAGITPVWPPP